MADFRATQSLDAASPVTRPAPLTIPPFSLSGALVTTVEGDCPAWTFDVDTTIHTWHAKLNVAGSSSSTFLVYDNHTLITDLAISPYQGDPKMVVPSGQTEIWVEGVWLFLATHVLTVSCSVAGTGASSATVRAVN